MFWCPQHCHGGQDETRLWSWFLFLHFQKFVSELPIFKGVRRAFLEAQMVKNSPAVQDIRIWSLGWQDPLKEAMATRSRILAWRIQWTEEAGGLQLVGCKESDTLQWLRTMEFGSIILLHLVHDDILCAQRLSQSRDYSVIIMALDIDMHIGAYNGLDSCLEFL